MITLTQQTQEWLDYRKNKIGASDASIIMGISPWSTPFQLWQRKLGLIPEQQKTEAMQKGLQLEPRARECFAKDARLVMIPDVRVHKSFDWMMASYDGINDIWKVILEIKCPGMTDHDLAKSGKIPDKYIPQLQHQLEVSGYDRGFYMSYVNDDDSVILEFNRDIAYIDEIIKKEHEFYEYMRNFISPPLTEKDYICKSDLHWNEKVDEWSQIMRTKNTLADREKELREQLIEMAGGQNCKGSGMKLQKVIRKGNIDYSKIPELANINLEKYRDDPVEFWKITMKQ